MLMGMMLLGAAAQGGKFTVKGTFEGRGDSVKFVVVDPFTRKPIMSEIRAITGEMLEVSFDLKKAGMLYVELSGNGNKGYMNAPAIPGEEVEFYRDGAFAIQGIVLYLIARYHRQYMAENPMSKKYGL